MTLTNIIGVQHDKTVTLNLNSHPEVVSGSFSIAELFLHARVFPDRKTRGQVQT